MDALVRSIWVILPTFHESPSVIFLSNRNQANNMLQGSALSFMQNS